MAGGTVELPQTVYIPDVLLHWPWPIKVNASYEKCRSESTALFASFHALSPKAQIAFDRCNFRKYQSHRHAPDLLTNTALHNSTTRCISISRFK